MGYDGLSAENTEQDNHKENDIFGMKYCSGAVFSGKWGIPKMESYTGEIPESFITVGDISRVDNKELGVAWFDSDLVLERMWRNLDNHLQRLASFKCVCEPDLSLKIGTPLAVQMTNSFRNHAMAYYMLKHGINVIPCPSWSDKRSFEFCFDGYRKGGAVLISTIGTLNDERSRIYFKNGFNEMLRRLSPDVVVLYGDVNEELMSIMPKQLEMRHIVHERFKRARRHGK